MSYDLNLPLKTARKIAKDSKNNSFSDIPSGEGPIRKVDVDGSPWDSNPSIADEAPYLTDRDASYRRTFSRLVL